MYCLSSRVTYGPRTVETRRYRSVHLGIVSRVSAAMLLVETDEKGHGRGAIVDVA